MSNPPSGLELHTTRFDEALEALTSAAPFAVPMFQTTLFQLAETLMASDDGMNALYERAPRFSDAGVFTGGPWEDPSRLQPALVTGGLKGTGVYPVVETLSELRVLALATERGHDDRMSAAEARSFLNEIMAFNLEFLFPEETEVARVEGGVRLASTVRLFGLIADQIGLDSLRDEVIDEIEQLAAQRPIRAKRIRAMILRATRIPARRSWRGRDRLALFADAVRGPSPLSRKVPDVVAYRAKLKRASRKALEAEARAFALSMSSTGLVCPHHAVLVTHLRNTPELLPVALGLTDSGRASLQQHLPDALNLIRVAVHPAMGQALYGFAKLLDRGLLARQEIRVGLERLVTLALQPDVREQLLAEFQGDDVSANAVLTAGAIAVFGQPLGVGQGNNPTCQAARAISLWAQHAQGYLLGVLVSAARDGLVEMTFEGTTLRSDRLAAGVAARIDFDLDPVSVVLVGHLDRLYDSMMRSVVLRLEDGHKWVNPELYGRWVPKGFTSVFADRAQTQVAEHGTFVRRFYATHHPDFNDGHQLMYPNPVGLCITNSHGLYLGPHAVSVQRIARDPDGDLRIYFYNPNNEGRQNWGHGVAPSISGHGEEEGESSLPFGHFASRLYAFHYNPYEEGDAAAVDSEIVAEVQEAARTTWGRAFLWT